MDLGRIGVWQFQLDFASPAQAGETLAELEALGYGTVWLPEAVGREAFVASTLILSQSSKIKVATGIASVWARDPMAANAAHRSIEAAFPERFCLGLGVSHGSFVDAVRGHNYNKPLAKMDSYLDAMDAAFYMALPPATPTTRVLAALGPKMLELSKTKAQGAHPYFVPVEHTAFARGILGEGPMLCPEQAVVLSTDADEARRIAREHMATYLGLPNYRNNLLRMGFTNDDCDNGANDKLVDAIVAWGDEEAIATRIAAHHDAGADHVCIQVLSGRGVEMPLPEWRRLAPVLIG